MLAGKNSSRNHSEVVQGPTVIVTLKVVHGKKSCNGKQIEKFVRRFNFFNLNRYKIPSNFGELDKLHTKGPVEALLADCS